MAKRWKIPRQTLLVLATVLAVGVVVTCFFVGKARERKAIVSKIVAGYRCRYTLSPDWTTRTGLPPPPLEGSLAEYYASAPNPTREWIAIHLFHQPPTPNNLVAGQPSFFLQTTTVESQPALVRFRDGYPELNLVGNPRILAQRHLRIDGCAATTLRLEFTFGRIPALHDMLLCVCTPDRSRLFVAGIMADSRYTDRIDREMDEIIASLHLEKVAEPSGGKQ